MAGANGQPAVGNAGSDAERVSTAALLAAMELIRGMSDNPAVTPADQLLDDIGQAAIGLEELTQAFAALLFGFLQVCSDADVDMIVGSVARRQQRLQLVPEVMVTRMHGAMDAAAAGRSPLGWHEQVGRCRPLRRFALPIPPGCWLTCSTTSVERGQHERDRVVEMLLTVEPAQTAEADTDQSAPRAAGAKGGGVVVATRGRLGPR